MTPKLKKQFMKSLLIIAGVLLLIPLTMVGAMAMTGSSPKQTTTIYYYDPVKEVWFRDVQEVSLAPNPDGTQPPASNTIEIRLDENNPIREIHIEETLVIRGNEPLLEIAGHDSGGSGEIHIGALIFDTVDADKLEIDADVVRTDIRNVAAEDNELDLDLNVVNVVRTGRGGPSKLVFGADPPPEPADSGEIIMLTPSQRGRTSLRVDRIRILGPSSGTAFIEKIIIKKSSVFGIIHVQDVKIQDLVLKNIMLEDSTSP